MKKTQTFVLAAIMLSSFAAMLPLAAAKPETLFIVEWWADGKAVITAIPPQDDSMTNSHYQLLNWHWTTTINYYINPNNKMGLPTSNVITTVSASANAWDVETAFQVFSYKGTTSKTAGKRDDLNIVSFGRYQAGAIAVTYIWYSGSQMVETDCRMNIYYKWSLTGEAGKMDIQNIMTHEFGHWVGLADLYNDADYWLTMYGYGDYGETYKRTLGKGDMLGLEAWYGP